MDTPLTIDELKSLIETDLKKGSTNGYWHEFMRSCHDESTLHTILKTKKWTKTLLESRIIHKWTPLHIAVFYENRVGIQFLLAQHVSTTVIDDHGYTPYHHAIHHAPSLLDLFLFPHQLTIEVDLYPLFVRWTPSSSNVSCAYQKNSDDFGRVIKELLLSPEIDTRIHHLNKSLLAGKRVWDGCTFVATPRNMESIATKLGFTLRRAENFYYPRDQFFRLFDGSIKRAHISPYIPLAQSNCHSRSLYLDESSATRSKNQLFNCWTGHAHLFSEKSLKEREELFEGKITPFLYSYVEGGNVYSLTNERGERRVLIGKDHLVQSMHILDLEQRSWGQLSQIAFGKHLEEIEAPWKESLSPTEILHYGEMMFAEGLLLHQNRKGIIERKQRLDLILIHFMMGSPLVTEDDRGWFKRLAIRLNLIPSFLWKEEEIASHRLEIVAYLAKRKITHGLIAKDFGVDPSQLHFITQFHYHIDNFLKPAPNHKLFLIDYSICIDLLEDVATHAKALRLSSIDQEYLARYITTCRKLHLELGSLLEKVKSEVESAGFTVIPTPGHWPFESPTMYKEFPMPQEGFNINFMNSLTGWSPQRGNYYYITHGVEVGERLGEIIMDLFTLFLRHHVPGIELYFIGRNPTHLTDLSEAMDFWNRLETQSGIHCATFELMTESHEDH